MSVLLEFSMFPTDRGESVSAYVAPLIALIRDSGLPYQLTPMGTIVEADEIGAVLGLVERCYAELERAGCKRIYASLKLDIRSDKLDRLRGKIQSVEDKIRPVGP